MIYRNLLLWGTVVLASCSASDDKMKHTDRSWSKCIFELDKVEAIRGRNLDDLDNGYTSARNQFMMDCMASFGDAPTGKYFDELSKYKANLDGKHKPHDMTLNSGVRK